MTELEKAVNSYAVVETEIWNISQYADAIVNGGDPELEAEHIRESVVIIENSMPDILNYIEGIEKAIRELGKLMKLMEALELWNM